MLLVNSGTLNVVTVQKDDIIKRLISEKIIKDEYACYSDPNAPGMVFIEINECYGDIEMLLANIAKEFKDKDVLINGQISYSGDYAGIYEIINGDLKQYSEEEWTLKEALKQEEIIGKPLAEQLCTKIKSVQMIAGLPVTANIALEEILKLISEKGNL